MNSSISLSKMVGSYHFGRGAFSKLEEVLFDDVVNERDLAVTSSRFLFQTSMTAVSLAKLR